MKWSSMALKKAFIFVVIFAFSISSQSLAQSKRIKPPAERLIFKCRLLINPATGQSIENAFIEVNNGKILRTGRAADLKATDAARVIDYSDKYIIPGLIDTHAHLYGGITYRHTTYDIIPRFYLAAGVTAARGPGSMDPESDIAMRNRIDSGRLPGPRYFLSGEYIEMDPVTVAWMEPVRTPEEVRLKIDHWISRGATSLKLYARMSGELMRVAIEHGHEHGVKVVGHISATSYKEAIEMGIDELHHGFYTIAEARPEGVPPNDFDKYAEAIAAVDLKSPKIQEVLKLAADYKVALTPTVVVLERPDLEKHHLAEQKKYFTADAWAATEKRMQTPIAPGQEIRIKKNIEFIKAAHDAGCILTTGTDWVVINLLPGYSLWREMEIFAEAGLKPMDILKAATFNGAYSLGRTDQLGTVEASKLADFVVLNSNPLDSISNVRSVHRVVKGGIIYDPEELLKPMLGKVH
jgi:enamidase